MQALNDVCAWRVADRATARAAGLEAVGIAEHEAGLRTDDATEPPTDYAQVATAIPNAAWGPLNLPNSLFLLAYVYWEDGDTATGFRLLTQRATLWRRAAQLDRAQWASLVQALNDVCAWRVADRATARAAGLEAVGIAEHEAGLRTDDATEPPTDYAQVATAIPNAAWGPLNLPNSLFLLAYVYWEDGDTATGFRLLTQRATLWRRAAQLDRAQWASLVQALNDVCAWRVADRATARAAGLEAVGIAEHEAGLRTDDATEPPTDYAQVATAIPNAAWGPLNLPNSLFLLAYVYWEDGDTATGFRLLTQRATLWRRAAQLDRAQWASLVQALNDVCAWRVADRATARAAGLEAVGIAEHEAGLRTDDATEPPTDYAQVATAIPNAAWGPLNLPNSLFLLAYVYWEDGDTATGFRLLTQRATLWRRAAQLDPTLLGKAEAAQRDADAFHPPR